MTIVVHNIARVANLQDLFPRKFDNRLMKKISMNFIAIFCFVLLFSFATDAQRHESDAVSKRIEKMKQLDFLIGDWRGKGWIMTQNGRQTFSAFETVKWKLDGQIAVVDGLGKSVDEKTGKERIVHQTYGVFSYDLYEDEIMFRWYKANGGEEGYTAIDAGSNTLSWGFEVPEGGVTVKFTEIINEKGNWLETGEVSRDGKKTWLKFFEMELEKQ